MSTYEKIFGDTDPFKFKCPVPGEVEKVFLSYEKKGPWLFRVFVGDEKLPSYVGIIINRWHKFNSLPLKRWWLEDNFPFAQVIYQGRC